MTGKEQEIKALTKLVEMNGYFGEYFKKDFSIELGANFNLTRDNRNSGSDRS